MLYFYRYLQEKNPIQKLRLKSVKLTNFSSSASFFLKVLNYKQELVFTNKEDANEFQVDSTGIEIFAKSETDLIFDKDFKVVVMKKGKVKTIELLHFWVSPRFVTDKGSTYLCLNKSEIDGTQRDTSHKKYKADFCVEVFFDLISVEKYDPLNIESGTEVPSDVKSDDTLRRASIALNSTTITIDTTQNQQTENEELDIHEDLQQNKQEE